MHLLLVFKNYLLDEYYIDEKILPSTPVLHEKAPKGLEIPL